MRKLIAFILALALLLSNFGFAVSAAREHKWGVLTYEVSSENITITEIDSSVDYDLKIPERILGKTVTGICLNQEHHCKAKSISVPKTVTNLSISDFRGEFIVDSENEHYFADETGALYEYLNKEKTELRLIFFPDKPVKNYSVIYGTVEIGDRILAGRSEELRMDSLTLPSTIKKSFKMEYCNIGTLIIPGSIKKIENYSFSSCQFGKLVFSEGVESFDGNVISLCSVDELVLPASLKSISDDAFNGSGFGKITVAPQSKHFYTDENGVLFNNDKSVLLKYPTHCTAKSYKVPDTVVAIGVQAFGGEANLESIELSKNLKRIELAAFSGFYSLPKNMVIPQGTEYIGAYCFEYFNVNELVLPVSLKQIGEHSMDCRKIYYEGTKEQWEALVAGVDYECSKKTELIFNYVYPGSKIETSTEETTEITDEFKSESLIASSEAQTNFSKSSGSVNDELQQSDKTRVLVLIAIVILILIVVSVLIVKKNKAKCKQLREKDKNKKIIVDVLALVIVNEYCHENKRKSLGQYHFNQANLDKYLFR